MSFLNQTAIVELRKNHENTRFFLRKHKMLVMKLDLKQSAILFLKTFQI